MTLLPMSRIALRNLLTKPATRRYPHVVRVPYAATRGRVVIDHQACSHCLACARRCPSAAIVVDRQALSWRIDRFACVICGVCLRVCPKKCLAITNERSRPVDFSDLAGRVEEHRGLVAAEAPHA